MGFQGHQRFTPETIEFPLSKTTCNEILSKCKANQCASVLFGNTIAAGRFGAFDYCLLLLWSCLSIYCQATFYVSSFVVLTLLKIPNPGPHCHQAACHTVTCFQSGRNVGVTFITWSLIFKNRVNLPAHRKRSHPSNPSVYVSTATQVVLTKLWALAPIGQARCQDGLAWTWAIRSHRIVRSFVAAVYNLQPNSHLASPNLYCSLCTLNLSRLVGRSAVQCSPCAVKSWAPSALCVDQPSPSCGFALLILSPSALLLGALRC